MTYLVSITSQGQISIPAALRRLLNLDEYPKAYVSVQDNKLIVEPVTDVLSSQGVFSAYARKSKGIDDTLKYEQAASRKHVLKKFSK